MTNDHTSESVAGMAMDDANSGIVPLTKRLRIEFALIYVITAAVAVLFEMNVLPAGVFATNKNIDYVLNSIGVLLMLLCVPLGMKLFSTKTKEVSKGLNAKSLLAQYHKWSLVRTSLVGISIIANITIYYLTLNTNALLCALMTMVASLFCRPSSNDLSYYLGKFGSRMNAES